MAVGGGAERWEIDLAVKVAMARHLDSGHPDPVSTDEVCDLHDISDPADRRLVCQRVALLIALEARGVAA